MSLSSQAGLTLRRESLAENEKQRQEIDSHKRAVEKLASSDPLLMAAYCALSTVDRGFSYSIPWARSEHRMMIVLCF